MPSKTSAAAAKPATSPPAAVRPVNLALQGGGAHGAFTWGVLDALLEDGRLEFEGISGASAGAVNAVALAHGMALDTDNPEAARAAARDALSRIWRGVMSMGSVGAMAKHFSNMLLGNWSPDSGSSHFLGSAMSSIMSPYQSNPLDINPLRKLLEAEIDFEAIARKAKPRVFVAATHVNTGRSEIFSGKQLTLQTVMASTCLPTVSQAVEVNGQAYWDGGFSSNPPLLPLITQLSSRDIIVVQINPLRRASTPQTPRDIADRVSELTFNASLLSQMRTADLINRLLAEGRLQEGEGYKSVFLHRIDGGEALEELPASSKMSADAAMIESLFDLGRQAAKRWLRRHFEALGQQSTVNIRRDYVGTGTPLS